MFMTRHNRNESRKRPQLKLAIVLISIAFSIVAVGFCIPEELIIPVKGATKADWNPKSFGFYPWGRSGVHKGIDIFAKEGLPVLAATSGLVVNAGTTPDGGNVISILGPKWRVHYYAHLKSVQLKVGDMVSGGQQIGTVGATGNAAGKPPHLHYAIITQLPYIWLYRNDHLGVERMFFLNPDEMLKPAKGT
jgi:murein DD-endopeptidase MepM/ murein hydrolase activator NlpD